MAIFFCINQIDKISFISEFVDLGCLHGADNKISQKLSKWVSFPKVLSLIDGATLLFAANRKWNLASKIWLHPASPAQKIVGLSVGLCFISVSFLLIVQKVFNSKISDHLPEQIKDNQSVQAYFEAPESQKTDRFYRVFHLIETVALIWVAHNPYFYVASLFLQLASVLKAPYERSILRYDHTFQPFELSQINLKDFLDKQTVYSVKTKNRKVVGISFQKGESPTYFIPATEISNSKEIEVSINAANQATYTLLFQKRDNGTIFLSKNPIPFNQQEQTIIEVFRISNQQPFQKIKVSFFSDATHLPLDSSQNPNKECFLCQNDLPNKAAVYPCKNHFVHDTCLIGNIYTAFEKWQKKLNEYLKIEFIQNKWKATILEPALFPNCPACKVRDEIRVIRIFITHRITGIETEVPLSR